MTIRFKPLVLPAGLLAALLLTACHNTAEGLKEDTENNTEKAKVAAVNASNEADRTSRDAVEKTADVLDAAAQTLQIKTALIADKSVDASGIDVDTNGEAMTVMLKGLVKNEAQKVRAEEIAREKAPGYTIVNKLAVEPS